MTFTIPFVWWQLPTLITIAALLWAFFWPANDRGSFGGIVRVFMLVPALSITTVAWMIAAALK